MMHVPESLKVLSTGLLYGCDRHSKQADQHDVAGPAGTCCEIDLEEPTNAEIILSRKLREIVPMCYRMYGRKED